MDGNRMERGPSPGYRAVLARPGAGTYYTAMAMIRTPVGMAPLALVFLGYSLHSFSLGGVFAAAYAIGEAAGAPVAGRRFDARPFVRELRTALLLEAACFALLAAGAHHLPAPALIAATFLAGACGAGVPGGMRSQLAATAPEDLKTTALILESALNQTMRAAAHALASLLYAEAS